MNMIHVTNKKSGTLRGIRSFYVGRPSVLRNKYEIGPDGTRKEVIEKYDNWSEQMMQEDSPQRGTTSLLSVGVILWPAMLT